MRGGSVRIPPPGITVIPEVVTGAGF